MTDANSETTLIRTILIDFIVHLLSILGLKMGNVSVKRGTGAVRSLFKTVSSIMIERQLPYTYLLSSIVAHPSLMECLQGAAHIIAGDALAYESGEEFRYSELLDE